MRKLWLWWMTDQAHNCRSLMQFGWSQLLVRLSVNSVMVLVKIQTLRNHLKTMDGKIEIVLASDRQSDSK